jgi:prepilin peptidase CpaA
MPTLAPTIRVLVAAVVLIAGYYDIRYRRIPNWLVLPALLVGFLFNAVVGFIDQSGTFVYGLAGLKHAALGFGVALLIYFPMYLLRGMGAGDVKMMAALGALLGWQYWLIVFVLTAVLGLVLALVLMLTRGRFRKTLWNTGYLVWEIVHFRAPHLKHEELDISNPGAFTLPHGAVIALGTMLLLGLVSIPR